MCGEEGVLSELTELLAELAMVQDRLIALPDDAFAERHALRTRQDELRARAAEYQQDVDAGRSRAELEAELAALKARVESIRSQRIDPVRQAGGGPGGGGEMGNLGATQINQAMEAAQGVPGLRARIAKIEAFLAEAGS